MSISDKPGRSIELLTVVDFDKGTVQVMRKLKNTRGFLQDVGDMGVMKLDDYKEWLKKETLKTAERPTLIQQFGLEVPAAGS